MATLLVIVIAGLWIATVCYAISSHQSRLNAIENSCSRAFNTIAENDAAIAKLSEDVQQIRDELDANTHLIN